MELQAIVARIAQENERHFGSEQGQGNLTLLAHASEARWSYLTELLQNAIDAGARRIAIATESDMLSLQHDGPEALIERSVVALSGIGGSTKGLDTVGFMGVGFKSVFRRASGVRINGFGWSFGYTVKVTVGQLGERRMDWLGAVRPIWDDSAPAPDEGFTTRFTLTGRLDDRWAFDEDVREIFGEDRTIFAVLAHRGLRQITLNGQSWTFERRENESSAEVVAETSNNKILWRVFSADYDPSEAAIRRLLETRRPHISSAEAADYRTVRRKRVVLGVVPLDAGGAPLPPSAGRIYATMPTRETWPFRMHIQADWLLSITRSGLPELEENEWQDDIVNALPNLIASYLRWVAASKRSDGDVTAALSVLANPSASAPSPLERAIARPEWLDTLRRALSDVPFIPCYIQGVLHFLEAANVRLPPEQWRGLSDSPELRPDLLFGVPTVASHVLGAEGLALLSRLGVLAPFTVGDLVGADAKERNGWWQALEPVSDERLNTLIVVWSGLHALSKTDSRWTAAPFIVTETGEWRSGASTFEYPASLETGDDGDNPATSAVRARIANALPTLEQTACIRTMRHLRATPRDWRVVERWQSARAWIKGALQKPDLAAAIRDAIELELEQPNADHSFFIRLAQWARFNQAAARAFVNHVVVRTPAGEQVEPIARALVAEPYVPNALQRRAFWEGIPVIVGAYLEDDPFSGDAVTWTRFFEDLGAVGPIRVREDHQHFGRYWRGAVATAARTTDAELLAANDDGYKVTDYALPFALSPDNSSGFAALLDTEPTRLLGFGRRRITSFYQRPQLTWGGPSSLIDELNARAWVPTTSGLRRPAEALRTVDRARPEAPIARLQDATVSLLEREGVRFGVEVPQVAEVARLKATGNLLGASELASLLHAAVHAAESSARGKEELREVVCALLLPVQGRDERVTLDRVVEHVGGGYRSDLNGWVAPLDHLDPALRVALEAATDGFRPPNMTTGGQALAFLASVWAKAKSGDSLRADELRESLAAAYGYVIADASTNHELALRWRDVAREAWIYGTAHGKPEWRPVDDGRVVYFDDRPADGLRDFLREDEYLARAGHLGRTGTEQRAVAVALGLRMLGDALDLQWLLGREEARPEWAHRYSRTCVAIKGVVGPDSDASPLVLRPVDRLVVRVRGQLLQIPARVDGDDLVVAGDPADFARAAALITLERMGAASDPTLAMDVALILRELGSPKHWKQAISRFSREHGLTALEEEAQTVGQAAGHLDSAADATPTTSGLSPLPIPLSFGNITPSSKATDTTVTSKVLEDQRAEADLQPGSGLGGPASHTASDQAVQVATTQAPAHGHSPQDAPDSDTTPDQIARGLRGEEEFLRRVTAGWAGLHIIADRRFERCGFDFECTVDGGRTFVELKTVAPDGRILVTPNEIAVAKELRTVYILVCLLDDGTEPSTWQAFTLADPAANLEAMGEWRNHPRLEVPFQRLISRAASSPFVGRVSTTTSIAHSGSEPVTQRSGAAD